MAPAQTQMLGEVVRTLLTLLALFATLDFMIVPTARDWFRERKRARQAAERPLAQLDDRPPDRYSTRHGSS